MSKTSKWRYHNDPEYRQRTIERSRERYKRIKSDPELYRKRLQQQAASKRLKSARTRAAVEAARNTPEAIDQEMRRLLARRERKRQYNHAYYLRTKADPVSWAKRVAQCRAYYANIKGDAERRMHRSKVNAERYKRRKLGLKQTEASI